MRYGNVLFETNPHIHMFVAHENLKFIFDFIVNRLNIKTKLQTTKKSIHIKMIYLFYYETIV